MAGPSGPSVVAALEVSREESIVLVAELSRDLVIQGELRLVRVDVGRVAAQDSYNIHYKYHRQMSLSPGDGVAGLSGLHGPHPAQFPPDPAQLVAHGRRPDTLVVPVLTLAVVGPVPAEVVQAGQAPLAVLAGRVHVAGQIVITNIFN